MPPRQHEEMSFADRVLVEQCNREDVADHGRRRIAERTVLHDDNAPTTAMPAAVSISEPNRCALAVPTAHRYSPLAIRPTTSLENVEKVVRPPMNPVMTNNR